MVSNTEENYLKIIFRLQENNHGTTVNTNALAEATQTKAASVSDMIKRLNEKGWINYTKYQGVNLTDTGRFIALDTIRRHRIWEVFLVEKLQFTWDEIHEIAEELEHINAPELINRLDKFLDYPSFDPHGDPIPNALGVFPAQETISMLDAELNKRYKLLHVSEDAMPFLKHLDKLQIKIGVLLKMVDYNEFDQSMMVEIESKNTFLSKEVLSNLHVKEVG